MKTTLVVFLGLLILAAPCMAKDKEYYTGTLTKVPLHVEKEQYLGFTDTTNCSSGLASTHCTGGVTDDYKGKLIATMPDGHLVVIRDCYDRISVCFMFTALGFCFDRRGWDHDVFRACAVRLRR